MSDLISRQAAIEAIERLILPQVKGESAVEDINRIAWRCAINCAKEMIGHLPSAEQKTGVWLKAGQSFVDPHLFRNFFCSICGHDLDEHIRIEPNYCPNCGVKMQR